MGTLDRLGTNRLDAALAVGFTVVGLVQAVVWPLADGVVGELFVLGLCLPLAWRRTRPVESTLVASAFFLVPLEGYPVLGFFVVVLQFFALGSHGAPRTAVAAVTAFATATSVAGTLLGPEQPVAAIGGALVVVAPVLAGRLVRHLRRQNAALTDLTEQLRAERARAEEAAVGAERARIAQELHDVVGHEVTLIAIQSEAAKSALAVSPERAAEPLEAIRTTAHRTLAEMRAVLDVLAPGGDGPAGDDLAGLVDRAQAAGIPATLTETGTPLPDHAPAALAVHRVVRECLTNAGRHAPGAPVTITVAWDDDAVRVESANAANGAAPVPGRGLTGIRHRAELLGGSYEAGVADGRFTVRVRIPVAS